MLDLANGLPETLFDKLKPFYSGMDISDILIITNRIRNYTFEQYTDFMVYSARSSYRTFYDITKNIVQPYMKGK